MSYLLSVASPDIITHCESARTKTYGNITCYNKRLIMKNCHVLSKIKTDERKNMKQHLKTLITTRFCALPQYKRRTNRWQTVTRKIPMATRPVHRPRKALSVPLTFSSISKVAKEQPFFCIGYCNAFHSAGVSLFILNLGLFKQRVLGAAWTLF